MNRFQVDLLKEIIELISPAEVGDISVSITKGPDEAVIEAKLVSRQLSLWIYEDGASILGEKVDIRFEAESYRNLSALAETFLRKVSDLIRNA